MASASAAIKGRLRNSVAIEKKLDPEQATELRFQLRLRPRVKKVVWVGHCPSDLRWSAKLFTSSAAAEFISITRRRLI